MRIEDLSRLLETHGADPARWPPARRAAALALLGTSAEARRRRAAAAAVDALLRESLPEPDAETLARMRDRLARAIARAPLPEAPRRGPPVLRWLRPLVPAGCGALAALATCLLLMGLSSWPRGPAPEEVLGAPRLLAMMMESGE